MVDPDAVVDCDPARGRPGGGTTSGILASGGTGGGVLTGGGESKPCIGRAKEDFRRWFGAVGVDPSSLSLACSSLNPGSQLIPGEDIS